ncbi:SIMPL domain-containing protein [Candidatus Woesearchaeota archaeon]|nr:SIMPL domain-containing protein [Candidatus Woesearchaeota archaeon]
MGKGIAMLGTLGVLVLLLSMAVVKAPAGSADIYPIPPKEGPTNDGRISVSGQAAMEVSPDQAEIYLDIGTSATDAKAAQEQNARINERVLKALREHSLEGDAVQTTQYNLYPWYEWENSKNVFKGYKLHHTLKVTTEDIKDVGSVLDDVVSAGVNRVNQVQFSLTRAKQQDVSKQILKLAAANAKAKAEGLASQLDVQLGKAVSVSESNMNYPRYYDYYPQYEMAEMKAASTEVQPRQVTLDATVSVVFAIV